MNEIQLTRPSSDSVVLPSGISLAEDGNLPPPRPSQSRFVRQAGLLCGVEAHEGRHDGDGQVPIELLHRVVEHALRRCQRGRRTEVGKIDLPSHSGPRDQRR